jgi:hypothetical protein
MSHSHYNPVLEDQVLANLFDMSHRINEPYYELIKSNFMPLYHLSSSSQGITTRYKSDKRNEFLIFNFIV